jgi:hypothetical protein
VVFISRDLPHSNNHDNILRSEETAAFMLAPYDELLEMQREQGWTTIPEDVLQDFFVLTKIRMSGLDLELMDEINDFFEMSLE